MRWFGSTEALASHAQRAVLIVRVRGSEGVIQNLPPNYRTGSLILRAVKGSSGLLSGP